MELVLKMNTEKLFSDTQKVKHCLEVLEKDHAAWARSREAKDLAGILEGIKNLEFDVSFLISNCVSMNQMNPNNRIEGDLHQAFKGLNTLFEDLKIVRKKFNQSYTTQEELEHLEIDWARFKKTVEQIQEDLKEN